MSLTVMFCLLYWRWFDKIDLSVPYFTVACVLDIVLRVEGRMSK